MRVRELSHSSVRDVIANDELHVFSVPVNVAKGKPAFQSSTWKDADASLAVDGWSLADISLDSCARTLVETDPWWLVNLEAVYLVTSVQLQDAAACCREFASNATRWFMGPTWGPPGPTGPRWVPCWPHELCYLGSLCNMFCLKIGKWIATLMKYFSSSMDVPDKSWLYHWPRTIVQT